jgi:hypothetical protein
LAPLALGLFKKKRKGPNRNAILARYRDSKPVGYTTAEDRAAAESTRTRGTAAAQQQAQLARMMNARQVTARGLAGPAAAALEQGATDVAAQGSEEASRNSADQLYKAFQGNLGYARQQNDTAFGAELGLAAQEGSQKSAQDATFWNSMLEAVPAIASGFGGYGRSSAPTAGGAPTMTSGGIVGSLRPPTLPMQR